MTAAQGRPVSNKGMSYLQSSCDDDGDQEVGDTRVRVWCAHACVCMCAFM
jgi:hypothetical protein